METLIHELISKFEQFKDPKAPLDPQIRVLIESLANPQPQGGPEGVFPNVPVPPDAGGASAPTVSPGAPIEETDAALAMMMGMGGSQE
jgi:hypothetical protein